MNELKDAISNDKNVVFSKDLQGATPLHHASFMGHLEVAKYLVKKGKPIKSPCINWKTISELNENEQKAKNESKNFNLNAN